MTKISVTKDQIIEALTHEPLEPGFWSHHTGPDNGVDTEDCPVCAVGAVVRRFSNLDGDNLENYCHRNLEFSYDSDDNGDAGSKVNRYIEKDCYFSALMVYFESIAQGDRDMTIQFVRDKFPADRKFVIKEGMRRNF